MERSLEIYSDGRIVEYDRDQPIKVIETQGDTKQLLQALKFSQARTFTIADPGQVPPEIDIPERRGSRHINSAGLKLLTSFEGCELESYDDGVGVWTIGYGHTKGIKPGMTITQAQAEDFLKEDLAAFESAVEDAVTVSLSEDQFSALVAFAFNVGADALFESTLLKLLNEGDYQGAANQFLRWDKAGGQRLLGLTRRRLSERSLFRSQPWEIFREYEVLKLTDPRMQSPFVRHIQELLVKANYSISVTGIYDEATKQAVMAFQDKEQLGADGAFGVVTFQALDV
jgi:lysozyme